MDVLYDREVDAVGVYISDAPYKFTRLIDDVRNVDYGVDGEIVGLEFFEASKGVALSDLSLAEKGINPVEVARHLIDAGVTVLDTVTTLKVQMGSPGS